MSKTNTLSDAVLDILAGTDIDAPTSGMWIGLLTAVTDKEAGTVTETTYGSYARIQVGAWTKDTNQGARRARNTNAITFAAKSDAGSVTILAFGIYTAVSAGALWWIGFVGATAPILFTVDATDVTNNTLTHGAHGLANDQKVRLEAIPGSAAGLPTGVSENTEYFVVGTATDTIQLSTTLGGGAIDLTAKGECMVLPYTPVTINQNDTPTFAANALGVRED